VGALNELFAKYKSEFEFLLVYVREAHPTDGWQVKKNLEDRILMESAKSYEQKDDHASSCARNLGIAFTTLVDGMDNKVGSWPIRVGRIAFI
jgi:hypothetical protein